MSRIQIGDERVQRLLRNGLLPLYVLAGSVNALTEKLNAPFEAKQIYPNRLHSLLSAEPFRAINEATLEQIEHAVATALADGQAEPEQLNKAKAEFRGKLLPLWASLGSSTDAIPAVTEQLGWPPSVVRYVLEQSGMITAAAFNSALAPLLENQTDNPGEPDWAFQDDATACCVRSLHKSPNMKVGLIVPTGGTKTRIALRTGFAFLTAESDAKRKVVWVTHRKSLRRQARRELQKMLSAGVPGLPDDAAELLAQRFEFVMVGQLPEVLASADVPVLVIVDEAHHAAAASYRPIFETSYPLRGLFVTATPNRTDDLPIGIDEVAYSITYRELARRGVILIPKFEDFPVPDFNWSEKDVADLADHVISRTALDLSKTLVLAPRIHRVKEFYQALQARLAQEDNHPLAADDIGFIHGTANSLGCSEEEFLATFQAKPRAILISAQLLLEGFDDPAIDSVVITYASGSMIQLMQAVGRCVRYSPNKKQAVVIQAHNAALAYRFDHRWLYQEISDSLRPALEDVRYRDRAEREELVQALLERHNVAEDERLRIMSELETAAVGGTCRLMLSGLPYFGPADRFETDAKSTPILETNENSEEFRAVFNYACTSAEYVANPTPLLETLGKRHGFSLSFASGSKWRQYVDMLTSMHCAWHEIYGEGSRGVGGINRDFVPHGSTSWLTYVTFNHQPVVAPELTEFLRDCYNADSLVAAVAQRPLDFTLIVKLPLPLGAYAAYLLNPQEAKAFVDAVDQLRQALKGVAESEQFAAFAAAETGLQLTTGLPHPLQARLEQFLPVAADQRRFWLPNGNA